MANFNIVMNIMAKDNASGPIGRITNSLGGLAGKGMSGLQTMGGLALGGITAVTAAVGGLGAASLGAAMDMETMMSTIASNMNTTTDQIAPLGDLIQSLGLDPNLKVTAVEAAQAIDMLARNGLTMQQILDGAAHSTVLLANATGTTFDNAANIGTDAMAIFGIEAANMSEAVDGIVSVTTNSKFSIDDYALALAQGGGAAAAAGVEFGDFNTAIAAISPLFASGSDAGTSFKTMITRLTGASGPAADAMAELGIITEEGSNRFYDAEGNLRSMAEIAGILQDSLGGLSEEQRTQALSTIFGSDAMRAAVGLMNVGEEGFSNMMDTMSETDALDNAATRMDNLSGVMEILQGIGEGLMLTIGNGLLPLFRMFADRGMELANRVMPILEYWIGEVSGGISGFITELGNGLSVWDAAVEAILNWTQVGEDNFFVILNIVTALETFGAKLSALLSPIAQWIGNNIQLSDVLMAVGVMIASFVIPALISIVAAAAPVILMGAALIGAIALLRTAWETDFAGIRDFVGGVWSAITQAWDAFKALFSGDFQGFLTGIKGAWDTGWNALVTFLGNLWALVQPKLLEWYTNVLAWFQSVDWRALAQIIIDYIVEKLGEFWTFAVVTVTEWLAQFTAWVEAQDWRAMGFTVVTKIIEGLQTFWENAGPTLAGWWDSIKAWFESISWSDLGTNIITGIVTGLENAKNAVFDALVNIALGGIDALKAALGISSPSKVMAAQIGLPMGQGVEAGWTNALQRVDFGAALQTAVSPQNTLPNQLPSATPQLAAATGGGQTVITFERGAIDARGATPGMEARIVKEIERLFAQKGQRADVLIRGR